MARNHVRVAEYRDWTIVGRRVGQSGEFVADAYQPGAPIGEWHEAAFVTMRCSGVLAREEAIRLARSAIDERIAREEVP